MTGSGLGSFLLITFAVEDPVSTPITWVLNWTAELEP